MNESWYNQLAFLRALIQPSRPDVLTSDVSAFGQKTRTRIQQLRNRKRFKQRNRCSR